MKETVYIDWFLLISHFLWILAAAVILALLGIYIYKRKSDSPFGMYLKSPPVTKGLWLSAGMFLIALLLIPFQLPPGDLVTVKISEPKAGAALETFDENREFSPHELKLDPQNKSHRLNNADMKDNTLVLFWDGSIRTPYMRFPEGIYTIRFQAWGTGAKGVFPKIKVEFESPDEDNYLIVRERLYLELTKEKAFYSMPFRVQDKTIGRLRITYFNDLQVEGTTRGRDVWFRDASIQSTGTGNSKFGTFSGLPDKGEYEIRPYIHLAITFAYRNECVNRRDDPPSRRTNLAVFALPGAQTISIVQTLTNPHTEN